MKFRGERLSAAREALKAATKGKRGSQAWLAFQIGAHVTSVSDWERGSNEPSSRYAAAICAIPELELSLSDLFGSDDEEADRVASPADVVDVLLEALQQYKERQPGTATTPYFGNVTAGQWGNRR